MRCLIVAVVFLLTLPTLARGQCGGKQQSCCGGDTCNTGLGCVGFSALGPTCG